MLIFYKDFKIDILKLAGLVSLAPYNTNVVFLVAGHKTTPRIIPSYHLSLTILPANKNNQTNK